MRGWALWQSWPEDAAITTAALGLDLGTTRLKLGRLDAAGRLVDLRAVPAPGLRGVGLVREADPAELLAALRKLLQDAAPAGTPLGLASQRSSFLLWDRAGRALTPVISWQDRRAAPWCAGHAGLQAELVHRAGLLLSPHYAGPKLAALLAGDPGLATRLASGDALFGTLDTWLAWQLDEARPHVTDISMAARTGMFNIADSAWDTVLLEAYGVPSRALPGVQPATGPRARLRAGPVLAASLADQAAGALAVLDPASDDVLVNFGTGAFVLWPCADTRRRVPGYLTAPLGTGAAVLEGTINGAGPSLDDCAPGPTLLPAVDPSPDAFAVPDRAGIGAPHWRAGLGPGWSAAAAALGPGDRRRVMLEGLLFRVAEIVADLGGGQAAGRLLVTGGLSQDPAIAQGLAALTGRPVCLPALAEATLLGAARLAAGLPPRTTGPLRPVPAGASGSYLPDKFTRWRGWLAEWLNQASSASDSPQCGQ